MAKLNKSSAAIKRIRAALAGNLPLRLEFLGAISQLFRAHGIQIPDAVLANLTLCIPEERTPTK
jgi:hypothetical protein